MLTKRKTIIITAPVILLLGATVWAYTRRPHDALYSTAPIAKGDLVASVAASGTCNAVVTVQVGTQVSGNIKELYADFNTRVKKGQRVALIDPELFDARVRQARAAVDSAQAAVANALAVAEKAKADVNSAVANRENLRAEVAKGQVTLNDAKLKLDRRLALFGDSLIAKEEVESAHSTHDGAAAALDAVKAQVVAANSAVESAKAQAGVAEAQVLSARAQVRQAEANLAQAQLDLHHTEILAPVDGTVIARRVDVGQTVAASLQAPTLFEIAQDLTQMQVDVYVDEADIGRIQIGQKATFTVDAYPNKPFPATVAQIREAPINTQNVITYDVVLKVDNASLRLFPGMTANVHIVTDTFHDALLVPNAALRFRPQTLASLGASTSGKAAADRRRDRQSVWVLDAKGDLTAKPVRVGLTDGSNTVVASRDLKPGDLVVTGQRATGATSRGQANGGRMRGPGF